MPRWVALVIAIAICLATGSTRAATPAEIDAKVVSFRNDVMPIFMSAGCNAGSCHGSSRGQDGFRLSLFGYDPAGDYERITREIPNRRINLARPHESLMLLKSTGAVPHTGGEVFSPGSANYKTILRWIEAGAPDDPKDLPTPIALEVEPKQIELDANAGAAQLKATAKYSDGTARDVTRLALFQSSNDNSAAIDKTGLVTAKNRGEAFVMARFATFTVGSHAIVTPKGLSYTWPAGVPENNYIDGLVHQKLRKLKILPSELCDDATFVRRVFLDVLGVLPPPEKTQAFVASTDQKKREQLVDELLAREEFVEMWVMRWAELLKIRSNDENNVSYKATLLYYDWLKDRIARNVPMNEIVRELLGSAGGTFENPATNYFQVETDPMKVAENTAQVFAGMRLQCAQCHNHPFDRWTMDDYYGWTAFFSQVGRKGGEDQREQVIFNSGGGEVPNPVTKKPVAPKFLGGETPDLKGRDRRLVLADWLASSDNPYFARNMANVTWQHFLGVGIIDPVDDVRISNPPSNPELLDALAAKLAEYKYDFRRLVRDICLSRAYQLSSVTNDTNAGDERNFAHASVRRIRAEVLLDCISQVTEAKEKFRGLPLGARAVHIADGRTTNFFLRTFGRATRETVCSCEVKMEPNLSQALHLLNGKTVTEKVQTGGVVKRLLKEKKSPEQIVEELYLRCFARRPTAEESTKLLAAVNEKDANKEDVLNDVFWALLNSKEFIFNH